jgi:hypothetical protein
MITIIVDNAAEKNSILKVSCIIDNLRDRIDSDWVINEDDKSAINYLANLHCQPNNVLIGDEIINKTKIEFNASNK